MYNLHQGREFFVEKNKEILDQLQKKLKPNEKSNKNIDPMKEILGKIPNFYKFIKENIVKNIF